MMRINPYESPACIETSMTPTVRRMDALREAFAKRCAQATMHVPQVPDVDVAMIAAASAVAGTVLESREAALVAAVLTAMPAFRIKNLFSFLGYRQG